MCFVNVVLPSFLGLQATFPRLEECQDTIADIQWFIADFFPRIMTYFSSKKMTPLLNLASCEQVCLVPVNIRDVL